MGEPDRRPSAQEIEELLGLVRQDPGSPAFIDLGEAYLALGRTKDAIDVGLAGLAAAPDRVEGRVMIARAYIAQHSWKEAQAELLKVVKLDRANKPGFALLGEVLLRRNDYERAVPVLQHAQNLDPTSPAILMALRRARAGQALDAPPPVPPVREPRQDAPPAAVLPPPSKPRPPVPASRPAAPPPVADDEGATRMAAPRYAEPPAAVVAPPPAATPPATPRKPRPAPSVPPPSVAGVRPRVIGGDKPQNAAQAALRQSAAVGEGYLNELLTGGLFTAEGVRVADVDYDLKPDRRWGRSTRRMFVVLFTLLILGIGGGGGWWWWSGKQRDAAVAGFQKEAATKLASASFAGIEGSLGALKKALDKQKDNPLTFAYVAQSSGLSALLYGGDPANADEALKGARSAIKQPTQRGYRELVIGDAAVQLSRLAGLEAPATALAEVEADLDGWLAAHEGDRWARWLKGRAQLAAGQRTKAMASFRQAAESGDGEPLVIAMIDRADLLADDGKAEDALALYAEALAIDKDHPLAMLGRAMVRAENANDASAAIDDLSVKLDKPLGPRVRAYQQLALALAKYALDDYAGFAEALAKAKGPVEPRFLERVALAHCMRGDLKAAATAAEGIVWFGREKAEDDPLLEQVNVALLLGAGRPEDALERASRFEGVRVRLMRTQALIDLERGKDALAEADGVLEVASENLEAQIMRAWARTLAESGAGRAEAMEALEKLGRRTKSKLGRHALGMAALAGGNLDEAKKRLGQALEDISDESPNPVAYRTHAALAQVLIQQGDFDGAAKALAEATEANSGYLPALALSAKLALAKGDATKALEFLAPVIKDDAMTPAAELTRAEALVVRKGATADDRKTATEIVTRLKDKAPAAEIGRIAALIDPALPATLGVSAPEGAAPAAAPSSRSSSRRRRGR